MKNTIILIIKQYIYAMKYKNQFLTFTDAISRISYYQNIEKRIASHLNEVQSII